MFYRTIPLTKAGMTAYIKTCAHVMAKVDKKDCGEDDDKVNELAKELEGLILKAEHGTKATVGKSKLGTMVYNRYLGRARCSKF